MSERQTEPMRGSFGTGAFGPTVVIELPTTFVAKWLHDTLLDLTPTEPARDLLAEGRVQLEGVKSFSLVCVQSRPEKRLQVSTGSNMTWAGTSEQWKETAALVEPFISGRRGHQYLTDEGIDDALIELSYGETHRGL